MLVKTAITQKMVQIRKRKGTYKMLPEAASEAMPVRTRGKYKALLPAHALPPTVTERAKELLVSTEKQGLPSAKAKGFISRHKKLLIGAGLGGLALGGLYGYENSKS